MIYGADLQLAYLAVQAEKINRLRSPDPIRALYDPDVPAGSVEYDHSHVGPVPTKFHEKQLQAKHCGARHRFLFWANQSGKTSFAAEDIAEIALGRHPVYSKWANFTPGVTAWASALTWELWENVLLPELLSWLPPDRILDAPEPFKPGTKRVIKIRADNGRVSRIEGKSAEQGRTKYQARRVHAIWCDEEHPEPLWNEILMRLVRFGGITLHTMTPLKGFTWIFHRVYQPFTLGKLSPKEYFCSHAGLADNPSIDPEQIEMTKRNLAGNRSQLEARLHGKFAAPEGLVLRYDPTKLFQTWQPGEIKQEIAKEHLRPYCGVDFGDWRFAFGLFAADRANRQHVLEEVFSQRESLEKRATRIHKALTTHGVPARVGIYGDAANPTDIREINLAFRRIKSPYRVRAVIQENKSRATGVSRINNLIDRGAFLVRRGLGAGQVWKLGYDAANDGQPVEGSRFLWELQNWCYPERKEGEEQGDDPDDGTADGADMMAMLRYAIMSWLRPAKVKKPTPREIARKRGLEKQFDWNYDDVVARAARQVAKPRAGRGF